MTNDPITPSGFKKLKDELERLIKVDRPQNIKAIAEARAHGDLSENAEYHAAKEKQSFIVGRIQVLQSKITQLNVIDPASISQDKIAFGAKVKMVDVETEEEKVYFLVGPDESDIKKGMISILSPIARSLIGKEEGDVATVKAPGGITEFEIIEISFE
jgi:transcription elongation factor GreA